jgi:catechol 2,3-dioxygenase-like lactoylglutathione lyase family enzyme
MRATARRRPSRAIIAVTSFIRPPETLGENQNDHRCPRPEISRQAHRVRSGAVRRLERRGRHRHICEYVARPDEFVRSLSITTPEGARLADKGDWIIKGAFGVFYPLKPDLFETKFEPVEPFGHEEAQPSSA